MATAIYPFIDNDEVDLGKALTMLAVHDIGELITGDEMTFKKKRGSNTKEQEEALKLLDTTYHDLYKDIESQNSKTAKFAKSVDKLAGDMVDYVTPGQITIWRFEHFLGIKPDEIVPLMVKHKRPYMLWNPFLTELHNEIIARTKSKIEKVSSQ
jgi:hypothetical protein